MRRVLGRGRPASLRGPEAILGAAATIAAVTLVALALTGLFAIVRPSPGGSLLTVLFTSGVVGLGISGALLWRRAMVVNSGRLGWLAAMYLSEAVILLFRIAGIGRDGTAGQAVPVSGGMAANSLFAAYVFAGGVFMAARTSRFQALPRAAAVAGCTLVSLALIYGGIDFPRFVDDSNALRPVPRALWGLAGLLVALAVWRIWRVVGAQAVVDWTLRWPLVSIMLALASVVTRAASPHLYDAVWWTSLALQGLAGLVPLLGLVFGAVALLHRLEGFTEQLAVGLETEVRRAGSSAWLSDEPSSGDLPGQPGPVRHDLRRAGDDDRIEMRAGARQAALDQLMVDRNLDVVLQAVVDLVTGEVEGVEALSRISGSLATPPSEFFADAAAAGISREAELLAVRRALDLLPALPLGPWLALNVSPTTASSPELAELLRGHDRSRIVLELTEHAEVEEYDALVDALTRLRETGVRIAVDDAGAGFSSFRHVVRLRPEIVKLDMSLIAGIDTDPVRRALVASLVSFSSSIGSFVIAEGIETRAELEVLTALRVHYGQGYLLGRPRPAAEALVVTLPDTAAARGIPAAR